MKASVSSPLVKAIENVWASIQEVNSDVPDVVVTMGTGNIGWGLKLGHFAANVWSHGDSDVHELFVGAEGLGRGAAPVLGTLLHEAAHAAAEARGIKDTSRQGRYHNSNFKNIAEEFGIVVEHSATLGWSTTTVPDETQAKYETALLELDACITAHRKGFEALLAPAPGEPNKAGGTIRTGSKSKGGRRDTGVSVSCQCENPRRLRLARSTFEAGAIVCSNCGEEFAE